LIDIIFEKIYLNIRQFIWLKRCDNVIEWEKSQNIKNSSKRNYKEAVLNNQNTNNQNENRKNNKKLKNTNKTNNSVSNEGGRLNRDFIVTKITSNTLLINRPYNNVWGYTNRIE
jgi:hypothetical protein